MEACRALSHPCPGWLGLDVRCSEARNRGSPSNSPLQAAQNQGSGLENKFFSPVEPQHKCGLHGQLDGNFTRDSGALLTHPTEPLSSPYTSHWTLNLTNFEWDSWLSHYLLTFCPSASVSSNTSPSLLERPENSSQLHHLLHVYFPTYTFSLNPADPTHPQILLKSLLTSSCPSLRLKVAAS